jgi:hypothetical protein
MWHAWRRRGMYTGSDDDFCSSPNIIGVMKSRKLRWAWHVARIAKRGMYTGFDGETRRK